MLNFLRKLFEPRVPPPTIDDPVFGRLTYSRGDGWLANPSNGPEFPPIDLIIDAGIEGPTDIQRETFSSLFQGGDDRLHRAAEVMKIARRERWEPEAEIRLSGITLPSLGDGPFANDWTIWFEFDEVPWRYSYSVATADWSKFNPMIEN